MDRRIISHPSEMEYYLPEFLEADEIAIGLEASGGDPHSDQITALILAVESLPVLYLDCERFLPEGIETIKVIMASRGIKIFHNGKTLIKFFLSLGIIVSRLFDTMLAGKILHFDETGQEFTLDALIKKYLKEDMGSEDSSHGRLKAGAEGGLVKVRRLFSLYQVMSVQIREGGMTKTAGIEFQCLLAVAHMEYYGIYLDLQRWGRLTQEMQEERRRLQEALYHMAGVEVNVQLSFFGEDEIQGPNFDSNAYVLELLNKNGIPVKATSKRELYPFQHLPIVKSISGYRRASKLLSAFLKPIPQMIHRKTDRLHPQYDQLTAFSGRMSCYNPNIQQIPRDFRFRRCFTAPEGRSLVIADYSQIELRVAAQISRDSRMIHAYQNGEDLHLLTASYLANKPKELISRQERQAYKAVNLGLIYGMGAAGLQQTARLSYQVDMSLEQAEAFRNGFFQAYDGIAQWHSEVRRETFLEGRTLTGRRFAFREGAGLPERSNLPVQGTAADIIKKALGDLIPKLKKKTCIVAVVHDEILLECPETEGEETALVLKEAMENAANSILPDIPTTVETKVSKSWAEK